MSGMDLGTLIATLEAMPQDGEISFGFAQPHSYRGSYDEVAFAPQENAIVADMLRHAKSALGATFQGYKGGEFTMGEYTPTHIAPYGVSGEYEITDMVVRYWQKEVA